MSDSTCLEIISNLTQECSYAFFDRKAKLERELAYVNEKKSFLVMLSILLIVITVFLFSTMKNQYIIYASCFFELLLISTLCFFMFKYYSISSGINKSLSINSLKNSIKLTSEGIHEILSECDWSDKELCIIAKCIKENDFTYANVIEIKDSLSIRLHHKEKLKEFKFNKHKDGNIYNITQMDKLKQIRKFEYILKMRGYNQYKGNVNT